MFTFSTRGLSGGDAFAKWRAAICNVFVPLRAEPGPRGADFFGELRSLPAGGLTLTDIGVAGQSIFRAPQEISRTDHDVFFLTTLITGETRLTCGEDRKIARPGDMYLLDARLPFLLNHEVRSRTLALTIPRRGCGGLLAALDHRHGLVVTSDQPVGNLLREYLCTVAGVIASLSVAEREDVGEHLLALIGHFLGPREPNVPPPSCAVRAAMYARVSGLIDRKLSDPEFDPTRLAREAGVSLRRLQGLLAERDTSPMRCIFERRIAFAKRMLRDPAHAEKTITQIAFESGFRDLSHFGRLFASTTGMTPRAWRRTETLDHPP
jgi:AraC-like DNA-binding protein